MPSALPKSAMFSAERTRMPRKPRPMPASRPGVIRSSWMKAAAMTRVKKGAVDWRIPARPEEMCCSATLMSQNGIAMLTAPRTARCPIVRASRGSGVRVTATTARRIARPTRTRNRTRLSGGSVSTPILMKR